ncbi:MAG: lytic murein transglycosylase [Oligoflexales bacterium]|nr:lytic murein transglycosylase [Oligoflexales bacterium]
MKRVMIFFIWISIVHTGPLFGVIKKSKSSHSMRFTRQEIDLLIQDLGMDDWKRKELMNLFSRKEVRKLSDVVEINVKSPIILQPEKYAHFIKPESLNTAKEFKRKWNSTLLAASKKFSVDPNIIIGIMLVETRLGKFIGEYPLISVFASVYIGSRELAKDPQYLNLNPEQKDRISRKSKWALSELKALLAIKRKYPRLDIARIQGSFAGAFGICQFLPSSYVKWAINSSGKGYPNLFYEPDAIFSIANYLSSHGYGTDKSIENRRNALWKYNHSDVYVNTVITVAEEMGRSPTVR